MRSRKKKRSPKHEASRGDQMASESDFYGVAPTEQPLYEQQRRIDSRDVRRTGRHQAAKGRRAETADPREKAALLGILKSIILILFLVIGLFVLAKGVAIYEDIQSRKVLAEKQRAEADPAPRMVAALADFDIENQDARELFAERIKVWSRADELVGSTDLLVNRGNIDLALERCEDALRIDPNHVGALERLGELYLEKGLHSEAINVYVRLLGMDPSNTTRQERLIGTLAAYGDAEAVVFMARWYMEHNNHNTHVQRYLAKALFNLKAFDEAVPALERVLSDNPKDSIGRVLLADSYMALERYKDALVQLEAMHEQAYRDQGYYHRLVLCHAQLGDAAGTVNLLGKSAHLFGRQLVIAWIQDPRLDPVREERDFQNYADNVGGAAYAAYLENVKQAVKGVTDEKVEVKPSLEMPDDSRLKEGFLDNPDY